jgi:hypothetical protein
MEIVEPHFAAALLASSAAWEILELLPDNDLVDELKVLVGTQLDIFTHILQEKHYGTDALANFIQHTESIKKEVSRIKDSN